MNRLTVESALVAWVRAGSNLAASQVVLAHQGQPRPAGTCMTISIGDLIPLGAVDEVEMNTDLGAAAGEEVELRVTGLREFRVTVQAYSTLARGPDSAGALLDDVQTALALPSVREALDSAGVTPFDAGKVMHVPALLDTKFEGRAVLEVGFYGLSSISEYTGYIDDVEATSYMGPPDEGTAEDIDI